jgi:hypothetical protein
MIANTEVVYSNALAHEHGEIIMPLFLGFLSVGISFLTSFAAEALIQFLAVGLANGDGMFIGLVLTSMEFSGVKCCLVVTFTCLMSLVVSISFLFGACLMFSCATDSSWDVSGLWIRHSFEMCQVIFSCRLVFNSTILTIPSASGLIFMTLANGHFVGCSR